MINFIMVDIIIMIIILVIMFIIISIIVQNWSSFQFTWIRIPDISATLFRIFHLLISFFARRGWCWFP